MMELSLCLPAEMQSFLLTTVNALTYKY